MIVMKFAGTSVQDATALEQAISIIDCRLELCATLRADTCHEAASQDEEP
jgi:hypothetical protein